jgi:hypothetical protein
VFRPSFAVVAAEISLSLISSVEDKHTQLAALARKCGEKPGFGSLRMW